MESVLGWSFTTIGAFFAAWVIAYGFVQGSAPSVFNRKGQFVPHGGTSQLWVFVLALITAAIALLIGVEWQMARVIVIGLGIFGIIFGLVFGIDLP